jgi:predicted TIM-barrel fold metal-dependent hydrolase
MDYSFKTFSYYALAFCLLAGCSTGRNDDEVYYTVDDYQKVDKADTHVHIFTEGDEFMEQAIKDNFKVVTVCVDVFDSMDSIREQQHYSLVQKARHPSAVEFAASFSVEGWDEPDWTERTMAWLDSSINQGAVAVKVWKNIGMVYRDKNNKIIMVDDPKLDPIFKMLTDRKVTLLGHLGEPKNCWLPLEEMTTNNDSAYFSQHPQYHMYKHPELPSYEEQIAARDRMLEKNPNLTFVGAHLGSLEWSVDEMAKHLDRFPNMAIDMAARMGQLFYQTHGDREKVREFFMKYQDRLIYATDLAAEGKINKAALDKELHDTWYRDWRYLVTDDKMTSSLVDVDFQGLKLPASVVDKVFYKNAVNWFNAFEEHAQHVPVSSARAR